jgi:hypothetical protein
MSYNNRKQSVAKKFCKVCQDAGKSESEYTSHFVRDSPGPNGKVICPTLLSQNCRGCGINGHTYKYCPSIKQNVKEDRREQRWKQAEEKLIQSVKAPQEKKEVKEIVVKSGKYASILMSSSSDEEDYVPEKKIAHKKARILDENEVNPVPTNTYASRLMAPAPPKVENPKVKFLEEVQVKEPEPEPVVKTLVYTIEEKEVIKQNIKRLIQESKNQKCSWDYSSDEEDSDEEEEEEKPVIPQAPKVLKPIVLKSVKPVVEKIKEEDLPIIRKGPKVEVKKSAPAPAPKPSPAPVPVQKSAPVKKDMIQIELKDAWSDDEN